MQLRAQYRRPELFVSRWIPEPSILLPARDACPWTVGALPPGVAITSAASGTGPGTVMFQVAANSGLDLSNSFTIAEQTFTIQQEAASISGLNLIGSMPHIAAEENWFTTFTLVNNTASSNQVRLSLFGSNIDASSGGNPLQLPVEPPHAAGEFGKCCRAPRSIIRFQRMHPGS